MSLCSNINTVMTGLTLSIHTCLTTTYFGKLNTVSSCPYLSTRKGIESQVGMDCIRAFFKVTFETGQHSFSFPLLFLFHSFVFFSQYQFTSCFELTNANPIFVNLSLITTPDTVTMVKKQWGSAWQTGIDGRLRTSQAWWITCWKINRFK